jgi:hypothetical protein
MERKPKEKDSESSRPISIHDAIKKIAAYNARAGLDNEEQMLLFLQSWWSRTYNRPLKDPLLESYTIEELLYEFYDRIERAKAYEEQLERESDKIEEEKDKEAEDWAERMEREEREAEMRKGAAKSEANNSDPTKDPANMAWMEEQLRAGKDMFGETFGEDIEEKFDE